MSVFIIPVVALCIPLVVVPAALLFRHAKAAREMEHVERMRALKLGAPQLPGSGINWPGAAVCIALGAGVPLGTFVVAIGAVVAAGVDPQVTVVALFISLGALWAAKALGDRMIHAAGAPTAGRGPIPASKPVNYDPDAFDVVGSRG